MGGSIVQLYSDPDPETLEVPVICGTLAETLSPSTWVLVNCSAPGTASRIRIVQANGGAARSHSFCGIKVYGSSSGSTPSPPGVGVAIDVDEAGVPYVVNEDGNVFKYDASTTNWTKVTLPATVDGAKDIGVATTAVLIAP